MKKFISRFRGYLPVILFIGLLLIPALGFAQDADASQGSTALKGLAAISGVIIEVLTFLALLMLNFFGDLLGTEMITGEEAMRNIVPMWRWIRDLTNILFVGVLLFLAFSNLFSSFGVGGEGGNWTIKEKLPKLIIAIIAINFSLLGFRVAIDAVNVGTVAIFGIADTKLEPDINGLNNKLKTSHTWIKIDDKQQKDLKKGKIPVEINTESIAGGGDCGKEWDNAFTDGACKTLLAKGKDKTDCILTGIKEGEIYACRGFRESINDLFCRKWVTWKKGDYTKQAQADNKCVFMIKDNFDTILTPKSEPGQNLFAAFGSVFMHLERLPALGADINNLNDVLLNTLFSVILALAFIVALVVVFIAMLGRLIVLWIALVFSPLLVGASILGIDGGKGGEISGKIVTHLIMPLKIAAAFAVGFVMMSAMVEWNGGDAESSFIFGSALSQLGQNEYSFLWQIATIVLFWMAAFWAVEGSVADTLIKQIQTGAELLATTTAKTLTIDRPLFTVGTAGKEVEFSLGTLFAAPKLYSIHEGKKVEKQKENLNDFMGWNTKTGFTKTMDEFDLKKTGASLQAMLLTGTAEQVLASIKNGTLATKMKLVGFKEDEIKQLDGVTDIGGINTLLNSLKNTTTTNLKSSDFGKTATATGTKSPTEDDADGVDESVNKKEKVTDSPDALGGMDKEESEEHVKANKDNIYSVEQSGAALNSPTMATALHSHVPTISLADGNESIDVTIVKDETAGQALDHDKYIIISANGVVSGYGKDVPAQHKAVMPDEAKEVVPTQD